VALNGPRSENSRSGHVVCGRVPVALSGGVPPSSLRCGVAIALPVPPGASPTQIAGGVYYSCRPHFLTTTRCSNRAKCTVFGHRCTEIVQYHRKTRRGERSWHSKPTPHPGVFWTLDTYVSPVTGFRRIGGSVVAGPWGAYSLMALHLGPMPGGCRAQMASFAQTVSQFDVPGSPPW